MLVVNGVGLLFQTGSACQCIICSFAFIFMQVNDVAVTEGQDQFIFHHHFSLFESYFVINVFKKFLMLNVFLTEIFLALLASGWVCICMFIVGSLRSFEVSQSHRRYA